MASLVDRFLDQIEPATDSGCMEWGGRMPPSLKGYGAISMPLDGGFWTISSHRLAWVLFRGPIPDNLQVLHDCDNRACVNPSHLSIGTIQQNMIDRDKRGRNHNKSKTVCKYGHAFSDKNLSLYKRARRCKECRKVTERNRRKMESNLGPRFIH